ncbi:MAG: hypothetical protein AAGA84_10445 [Pseudomonadota bacterium]
MIGDYFNKKVCVVLIGLVLSLAGCHTKDQYFVLDVKRSNQEAHCGGQLLIHPVETPNVTSANTYQIALTEHYLPSSGPINSAPTISDECSNMQRRVATTNATQTQGMSCFTGESLGISPAPDHYCKLDIVNDETEHLLIAKLDSQFCSAFRDHFATIGTNSNPIMTTAECEASDFEPDSCVCYAMAILDTKTDTNKFKKPDEFFKAATDTKRTLRAEMEEDVRLVRPPEPGGGSGGHGGGH